MVNAVLNRFTVTLLTRPQKSLDTAEIVIGVQRFPRCLRRSLLIEPLEMRLNLRRHKDVCDSVRNTFIDLQASFEARSILPRTDFDFARV